jgi:hypothetical protein
MAQIIRFQEVRHVSAGSGLCLPKIGAQVRDDGRKTVFSEVRQHLPRKEDVFRAILLLDLAAQHLRLIVKEIVDPLRREMFQTQITNIEHQLQFARDLALKL